MDQPSHPPQPARNAASEPLRDDIRRIGTMVGEMLAEQHGAAFLEIVEKVRRTAIQRRRGEGDRETLSHLLSGLPVAQAEILTRAFATYFHAVNVTERVHRIRRRRDYQREDGPPQPDSLEAALTSLKAAGVSSRELLLWLGRLDIEPVFTAHPTEAVRGSILEKEQEIVRCLVNEFDPSLTAPERAADWGRLRMALTATWQTRETASVRPSVRDECEHVGFYLGGPIYGIVPAFYEAFENAVRTVYGNEVEMPRMLRFGSWVGGDMDGNPNVGAETIAETLQVQRERILERYAAEVGELSGLLSQTADRVDMAGELIRRIESYRTLLPKTAATIRPRHEDMPYRVFMILVRARLRATSREIEGAYDSAADFVADIELVAESLLAGKGLNAGWYAVRRLLWRARSFGFHLARLDCRQDSRVHARAIAALIGDAGWPELDAATQSERLRPYAGHSLVFDKTDDATAQRCAAVFKTLCDSIERYGDEAVGLYIISMAQRAADVLAVLALARYGGLIDRRGRVPLDIAPLFETVDDLRQGPDTLRTLLADPVYRQHLAARGNRQMVMLGYSDSGKDGGTVASRWGLQRAQVELLEVAQAAGIKLAFFHGRGGSASRGGGKIAPALMSSPRGSVAGSLRVTEQGEVIHRKYGIRALALRSLEQMVGATLRASLRPRLPETREADWREAMNAVAGHSRTAYRAFVDAPDFVDYFRTATPIDVIEKMTLGSRPSRRGTMVGVESLRAIPWVFAWTQCRAVLTAWYGLGSGLQRVADASGDAPLLEMARDWAFFRVMLDDVDMVLAKCDLDIAERFSRLSGPLHERFFPKVVAEFELTRHWVLRLRGQESLLAGEPRLGESIRRRNPYIDPISFLQLDLLQRWRASGGQDENLLHALVATVNGVAQGLQNTG
ncbi:phosphoenolpyruvate carboxylase type 1 [Panacagrimonas perspica]|uniref:Phosphoenolpyruvate carboxylase n=1 Tax=Panacagrimonas perspica TaxID=381431 RepID=A0A4R7PCM9_9GAMM|nr:phosphoenolpyruvate carboxylase [Panacagrimonas perspica]TDU31884.1 phosphoenolpyruvate carboxylase type 1 [Panacagrimonas perspica]THD04209.1 phosphoenolpyruvate carboxylase [Panacagrimonas perspica]